MATADPELLRDWMARVLAGRGLPDEDAAVAAAALLDASLRGVDTHGVALLPGYLDLLDRGVANPRPAITIRARGALLRVDADRGLGQVVLVRVLDAAVDAARRHGAVAAVVRQVGHLGALGHYTRRAGERGMLALLMQNGPPLMALPGAKARAIGNNPVSFAAPVAGRPPLVFDMATSDAAYGKLIVAAAKGEAIPAHWAMDRDGEATRDPRAAMEGILLPAGGAKGIALAMMVEAFAGSLAGTRPVWGENRFGAFLLVVDPEAATERGAFDADMAAWLDRYAASAADARYPGQRSEAVFRQRSRDGLELDEALGASFAAIGEAAGIPFLGRGSAQGRHRPATALARRRRPGRKAEGGAR